MSTVRSPSAFASPVSKVPSLYIPISPLFHLGANCAFKALSPLKDSLELYSPMGVEWNELCLRYHPSLCSPKHRVGEEVALSFTMVQLFPHPGYMFHSRGCWRGKSEALFLLRPQPQTKFVITIPLAANLHWYSNPFSNRKII